MMLSVFVRGASLCLSRVGLKSGGFDDSPTFGVGSKLYFLFSS